MSVSPRPDRTGLPGPTDAAPKARPRNQLAATRVVGEREQGGGANELSRAFKGAMAALRRMRGREVHRAGELSDAQFSLLFSLRDREQMSAGELAIAAELRPASVTEMLDGLAHHGLVERSRSDRDRRVVLTSLTERGRALVEERQARFQPRFLAAMDEFSEEQLGVAARVLDSLAGMFNELAEERLEARASDRDQPLH